MTYENEKYRAGGGALALGIIGTVGTGHLLSGANNGCNRGGGNGGLLGGILGGGNGCMWSDREVSLQRQIDYLGAQQDVTANVTPYQIREATCDVVRAQKFIPSREIVYTSHGGYCGGYGNYGNGCGNYGNGNGCDCYGI